MAATGLDVFDKTLQTTNSWLAEIMEVVGPDRQVAWHTLGAVLRTLRDRISLRALGPSRFATSAARARALLRSMGAREGVRQVALVG